MIEASILELAINLVGLWENPNIKALARSERNGAIEHTRNLLIQAVAEYHAYPVPTQQTLRPTRC